MRSRKVSSSLSPPPSLEAALLACRPTTFSVTGSTASRRPARVRDDTWDAILLLLPFRTCCIICCAFAVALGLRDGRAAGPDGAGLLALVCFVLFD